MNTVHINWAVFTPDFFIFVTGATCLIHSITIHLRSKFLKKNLWGPVDENCLKKETCKGWVYTSCSIWRDKNMVKYVNFLQKCLFRNDIACSLIVQ
jgi:hypothetical protein